LFTCYDDIIDPLFSCDVGNNTVALTDDVEFTYFLPYVPPLIESTAAWNVFNVDAPKPGSPMIHRPLPTTEDLDPFKTILRSTKNHLQKELGLQANICVTVTNISFLCKCSRLDAQPCTA